MGGCRRAARHGRALALGAIVLVAAGPHFAGAEETQPIVSFHPAASIVYAKSYGPPEPLPDDPASRPDGTMDDTVKQSIGCVLGGTVGTTIALAAGGENLVNIIAGGLVAPANPLVLYTGLVGVVFASFCAIGQAMTPLYLYYFETPPPVEIPGEPSPPMVRRINVAAE